MTLKIFKRDDSGMLRIFASPDEVRKPGECFEITDEQKNIKQMIVQVNDIIYIDTPEALTDSLREMPLEGQEVLETHDIHEIESMADYHRELVILICNPITPINDLPSRKNSKIKKMSGVEVLELVKPKFKLGKNQESFNKYEMFIGKDTDDNDLHLNARNFEGLTLITGMKGMGKSHLSKTLLEEMIDKKLPIIVFDLNGEYIGLENENIEVYYPGERLNKIPDGAKEFWFNYDYLGLSVMSNVMTSIQQLTGKSIKVFHTMWHELKTELGVINEKYNSIEEYEKITKNYLLDKAYSMTGENQKVMDAITSRIRTLNQSLYLKDEKYPTRLEEIIKPGKASIIVLNHLPHTQRKMLVAMILTKLKELLSKNKLSPMWIFAEEAHNYNEKSSWEDLVTRMRHFGINIVFITNQPDSLEEGNIFRQLDNIFLFGFKNDRDLEMISKISDIDSRTAKLVKNIEQGTCLAIGKSVYSRPIIIKVRKINSNAMGATRSAFPELVDESLLEKSTVEIMN